MPNSELLARAAKTASALSYVERDIECSSHRAPWRDLVRLERGRKQVADNKFTALWTSLCVIRAESGTLQQRVNAQPMQALSLSEGSVLTYPPHASIHARYTQPISATSVQIAPRLVAAVAGALGKSFEMSASWRAADEQLDRIVTLLEAEVRADCPGGRLYGEHVAYALTTHLLLNYAQSGAVSMANGHARREKIAAVLRYIHAKATQVLTLEELARVAHLSPYHFSRLFKQATGMTPHQYVLHWRVEEAKRLLLRGNLGLSEIAQRLGFRDQSHFTARFRQATGVTPKRWRDKSGRED